MSKKSVIFIDSRVADYQTIVAALPVDTDWYLLNQNSDGVSQIQSILANYSGLNSIHIISHGSVGAIQIGSGELSNQNIADYQSPLAAIGSSLTDTGDILLYGCNVAQGDAGQAFVQSLANYTGADVAASNDLTGNEGFGGNWDLECLTGVIESTLSNRINYESLLAEIEFKTQVINVERSKPKSVALADINGDGCIDIVTTVGTQSVSVLLNDGSGGFNTPQIFNVAVGASSPISVALADINGDGKTDIVTANLTGNNVSVLTNNGRGGFNSPQVWEIWAINPESVALADINGDGCIDIVTANEGTWSASVLINDGNRGFNKPQVLKVGAHPVAVALADVNGDGLFDIVTANLNNNSCIAVLINNGNGGFNTPHLWSVGVLNTPWSVALADVTGDGNIDIVTVDYFGNSVSLLINDGGGGFKAPQVFDVGANNPVSVALADVNGDGRIDIVTADSGSSSVSVLTTIINVSRVNDVPTGSVIITGKAKEGQQLVATNSIADVDGMGIVTYHWKANGTELATGENYILTSSEVGKTITVVATYTDLQGTNESVTSTATSTVLEGVAPTVTTFSPADAVTGVAVSSNIVLTFSEAIQTGLGSISIRSGSAIGTVIESYDVTNSQNLTISGNTLTINPSSDLSKGTHYFVTIDATAIQDLAGNAYVGSSDYNFTTALNLMTGGSGNDNLVGTVNDDQLSGLAGNDTLNGGAGDDVLIGGTGIDTFIIGSGADVITDLGLGGVDLLQVAAGATVNATLAAAWTASAASTNAGTANLSTAGFAVNLAATGGSVGYTVTNTSSTGITITGSKFADTLVSGAGKDTLTGGLGNDTYVVDLTTAAALQDSITEVASAGTDTVQLRGISTNVSAVTLILATNLENLDASNTASSLLNLTGNTANNILTGNAANNVLNGGTGADSLIGATGDETYIVDNIGDVVVENADQGSDSVQSSVTYTLSANVENLTLTGKANINATGNASANTLSGNNGNNVLEGGAGNDTLQGMGGNDTYVVDSNNDVVIESANAGYDTVWVAINGQTGAYSLASNIEVGVLKNTQAFNLTGNQLNNSLTGNAAANLLDGGLGIDTLIGGLGDDTYLVDVTTVGALEDSVFESANAGTDTLKLRVASSNVAANTFYLAANLENLDASATGMSAFNLTGNAANNLLTGNSANNTLDGGVGADILLGGAGNDTYVIDNAGDLVYETTSVNSGIDAGGRDLVKVAIATANGSYSLGNFVENGQLINNVAFNLNGNGLNNALTGNALANNLNGGAGADTLDGGAGNDVLTGGEGNDVLIGGLGNDNLTGNAGSDLFVFNSAPNASTNKDTLIDFLSGTDKLQFSKAVFAGLGSQAGGLSAGQFWASANATGAHDADDRLVYNTTSGALYYDADGNGGSAAVQIALIGTTTHPTLTYTDIQIIA